MISLHSSGKGSKQIKNSYLSAYSPKLHLCNCMSPVKIKIKEKWYLDRHSNIFVFDFLFWNLSLMENYFRINSCTLPFILIYSNNIKSFAQPSFENHFPLKLVRLWLPLQTKLQLWHLCLKIDFEQPIYTIHMSPQYCMCVSISLSIHVNLLKFHLQSQPGPDAVAVPVLWK